MIVNLLRLESESGLICNVKFIEELVLKGEWDVLEKYLAGFISVNENRYSVKILFEIRKQRYIEALERYHFSFFFTLLMLLLLLLLK